MLIAGANRGSGKTVRARGLRLSIAALALLAGPAGLLVGPLSTAAHASTPQETGQISTGGKSPWGVALDTKTHTLYATNSLSGTLSVIRSNRVVKRIKVGKEPWAVAVDDRTDLIYVTHELKAGKVSIIRGSTDKVVHTVDVGKDPESIAVDDRTDLVYVANLGSNNLTVIGGGADHKIVARVPTGKGPSAVAVNPETGNIYVADEDLSQVTVVHRTSVTATVNAGDGFPSAITVDPKTDMVYVGLASDGDEGGVTAINGHTNKPVDVIAEEGADCNGIAVDTSTDLVYVSSGASLTGEVTVFSGKKNYSVPVATIDTAGFPTDIVSNSHGTAWVASSVEAGVLIVIAS